MWNEDSALVWDRLPGYRVGGDTSAPHTPVIQRQTSPRVPASALVAPAHCFPQERCPGRREWVVTPAGRRAGDSDTGPESNLKLSVSGVAPLGGAGGGEDASPGPSREPATISSFKYLMPYAVDAGARPTWRLRDGQGRTAGSVRVSGPRQNFCLKCPWDLLF